MVRPTLQQPRMTVLAQLLLQLQAAQQAMDLMAMRLEHVQALMPVWVQVQLKAQVHGKKLGPTMLTVGPQACTGLRASMPQLSLQLPAAAAALLLTAARQAVPAVMAGLMPVSCRCWLWP